MNLVNTWVRALRYNHDGTATTIQSSSLNAGRGTMTLNIDQTAYVSFKFWFNEAVALVNVSGEYALFQIGLG